MKNVDHIVCAECHWSEDVTMSLTIRCPEANAMELGGVDTGSMKAYEHPTVAGIMKYRGFTRTRLACKENDQKIKSI